MSESGGREWQEGWWHDFCTVNFVCYIIISNFASLYNENYEKFCVDMAYLPYFSFHLP